MHETKRESPAVDLSGLVALFYERADDLGSFYRCSRTPLPQPYERLLNHHAHMTVTVEAHHGCPVDVSVARTRYGSTENHRLEADEIAHADWYAREITLLRQHDRQPVQYGIVRLNLAELSPKVWSEIQSMQIPLGRVLIKHQVLREVELCALWKVTAGDGIAKLMNMQPGQITYGRTARIFCDHRPAIELLEVVAPEPTDA